MGLKVEDLLPPLEPIDLPGGRENLAVRDFTYRAAKLYERAQQNDADAERALLHEIVPDITDEEIDGLAPGQKLWIVMHASRRLREVTEMLKNADGAAGTPATPPPSAPTTSSTTPSPASPAPSARTGSRKPRNRSAGPSSLSIG